VVTTTSEARYDGIADWYDGYNEEAARSHGAELLRLLGPGAGRAWTWAAVPATTST